MAATDDFGSYQVGPDGSLAHLAVITPDDSNDLAKVTRAIFIGAVGTLKVTMVGGETVTIPSGLLAANVAHRLRVTRIFATGTTATPIWVGW